MHIFATSPLNLDTHPTMPTEVVFIPLGQRDQHRQLIQEIARAIYGTPKEVAFAETYIPLGGRVPGRNPAEKQNNFARYLFNGPRLLWAIQEDGQTVGFVMIGMPHPQSLNTIGFSINSHYARRGILGRAFDLIRQDTAIAYPLFAETSEWNIPAQKLLLSKGFTEVKRFVFFGEPSIRYVCNTPKGNNTSPSPDTEQTPSPSPEPTGSPGGGTSHPGDKRFHLSKSGLENSAYYCGSGIDLQPLLRFSDIVDNFVYVCVGIERQQWIAGIRHFVDRLNDGCECPKLEILTVKNININDIEHPSASHFLPLPAYLTQQEYDDYVIAFIPFFNRQRFVFEIAFRVYCGCDKFKEIKLYCVHGEALATYEAFYVRQNIAPKIFISIQAGLIEQPAVFTNRMFELHRHRPKVWVRGVWTNNPYGFDHFFPHVFNPYGLYDTKIGEFWDWDPCHGYFIEGTTDPENMPYRIVRAFGESNRWRIDNNSVVLEGDMLQITKIRGHYNGVMVGRYNLGRLDLPPSGYCGNYLQFLYERYVEWANQHPGQIATIAVIPSGYEMTEGCMEDFVRTFKPVNNVRLEADIFYTEALDFFRRF
jgi:hypothetical protein